MLVFSTAPNQTPPLAGLPLSLSDPMEGLWELKLDCPLPQPLLPSTYPSASLYPEASSLTLLNPCHLHKGCTEPLSSQSQELSVPYSEGLCLLGPSSQCLALGNGLHRLSLLSCLVLM